MVEGGSPALTFPPSSWTDRGAARASGRGIPRRGWAFLRRGDNPPDGAVLRNQGAWARGQEAGLGSWRWWRIQGVVPPAGVAGGGGKEKRE